MVFLIDCKDTLIACRDGIKSLLKARASVDDYRIFFKKADGLFIKADFLFDGREDFLPEDKDFVHTLSVLYDVSIAFLTTGGKFIFATVTSGTNLTLMLKKAQLLGVLRPAVVFLMPPYPVPSDENIKKAAKLFADPLARQCWEPWRGVYLGTFDKWGIFPLSFINRGRAFAFWESLKRYVDATFTDEEKAMLEEAFTAMPVWDRKDIQVIRGLRQKLGLPVAGSTRQATVKRSDARR